MDLIDFTFKAPSTRGSHTVSYAFAANYSIVPDLEIDIPVEVTSDAPKVKDRPKRETTKTKEKEKKKKSESDGIVTDVTMEEPTVRIGVLIVDEETDDKVVVSCETDWKLYDGDEEEVAGVRSEIRDNSLALTANGRLYLIDLPK